MVRALFLSALFISSSALACKDLGPISDPNEPFRAEAAAGCVENLKILLGFPGLRVNGTDSSARTALILAAQNGQGETVAFLVEKTTSLPNLQDYSGNTALHYGAQSGNGLIVQALLRYPNTDPNILNKRGTSPFELALLSRSENAWMPFLQSPRLDKKAVYALHVAAKVGSINMMAKLLEAGYDVNDLGAGRWNTTVLRIAAESKNIELVQALLSVPGIDVNRGPADHSTLERAVWQSNNLPVIQLLLAHPDIEVNGTGKSSPLAAAAGAKEENFAYIQALLRHPRIDPQPGLLAQYNQILKISFGEKAPMVHPAVRALDLLVRHPGSRPAEIGLKGDYQSITLVQWALRYQVYGLFAAAVAHPSLRLEDMPTLEEAVLTYGRLEDFELVRKLPFFNVNRPGLLSLAAQNTGRAIWVNSEAVRPFAGKLIFEKILTLPGLDVNQADKQGFTALMLLAATPSAMNSGSWQALLRLQDIDLNLANKSGNTALSILLCQEINWDDQKQDQQLKTNMLLAQKNLDLARSGPALTCALQFGWRDIALQLLKAGTATADLNNLVAGKTPLMLTIQKKDTAMTAAILQRKDLDPNIGDLADGFTALHYAIKQGDLETVKLLLANPRTDLNRKARNGTPLSYIRYPAQRAILMELLARPAIAPSLQPMADYFLSEAIKAGDTELFDRITSFHFTNPVPGNALMQAVRAQQPAMVDKLLRMGADVNQQDEGGNTPLIAAAVVGHRAISERLLAVPGINFLTRNRDNYDAFFMAVVCKQEALALRLLKLPGIELNLEAKQYGRDVSKATPLFVAVMSYLPEVVAALVKMPVDVNYRAKRYDGILLHPLNFALDVGFLDIAATLAAHPAITAANIEKGVSTLMSLSSQTEATSTLALALLARGAPLNYQDPKDQRTALMLAIERNRPFISLTLAQAPGLDRTLVDRYKTNLLHFAAIAKDHAVLDLLLKDTSMPVNAVNDYRNTPLLYAASANDPLSISLLGTRLDLDPNPVNSYNGFTPLIEAAQRGLYPAVQALLLLKGIDKERRDLKGYTALMWAVKNGHHDVAKLLEQVK